MKIDNYGLDYPIVTLEFTFGGVFTFGYDTSDRPKNLDQLKVVDFMARLWYMVSTSDPKAGKIIEEITQLDSKKVSEFLANQGIKSHLYNENPKFGVRN